ncbi:ATP-binding cassette domain-containing protein [Corynebacterium camporealensis]|uniref:ABC transporter ATP-binding protein n=1 Tax=Corynebacterium camporealensis TaxID=161896 RepID=UPI0034CDDD29
MAATGIRARGYGWKHASRSTAALQDIDFDIQPGERVLLCGDSGSGKSTLVSAIAGVLGGDDEGQQSGSIMLYDAYGDTQQPGRDVPVGLVLQDPDSQVVYGRVGDDVAFGCENLGLERDEIWCRVHHAVDLVGLEVGLDHPTDRLSGGQKQRLALAGVIAMGAGVLLLDEPTANLDPEGAAAVIDAVDRIVADTGATLIVVEHNAKPWQHVLNRAICLEHGTIVSEGPVADVLATRPVPEFPEARQFPTDVLSTSALDAPALKSDNLLTRWGPPRSYVLPRGASTVITGPNGVGKSTWLMTMGGLLKPRKGKVQVADDIRGAVKGAPHQWSSKDLATRIGFVFQNPEHSFIARSVREEMEIGARVMGIDEDRAGIDKLLASMRLEHVANANPFTLSGGEKRRLSVAAALVAAPAVLLLDEPTYGQDPETFAELVRMLRTLADAGTTIASVTHDPLFIRALGDHRVEVTND